EAESFFSLPIIFWKKISTLESQNTLQFIIDGNVAGEWSGESDWTEETFMVSAGWHIFEWEYTKTAASGGDDDCVWIDYIKFPPNSSTMTASAGPDDQICTGDSYTLSGDAQNYETIEWTTSGDGTFDDFTILNPDYTPGALDIEAGSVVLTITVYDGERESTTDNMTLTIQPQPVVFAGDEGEICQGNDYATTNATEENCESILWTSSGDGTFSDNTLLISIYTPGPNDIANGQVTLTIAAQGFEPCGEVSDEVQLMIYEEAETPATPTGPDYVDIYYTPTSEYSTTGSVNATSYFWVLSPVEAGSIAGTEEVAQVTWGTDYLGEAIVSVKGVNPCGEGEFSEGLVVMVDNTVGW
ncbi:MAG: hypothetical protein KAG99_00970, partial [Bacteroidales bacterium]|nr:hypothetical protein [Bacteroidales bacterium]